MVKRFFVGSIDQGFSDLNGIGNVMEVQNLDKKKGNSIIREVCKQGAGFRQLARITGISYGIIQRVVTDQSPLIYLDSKKFGGI